MPTVDHRVGGVGERDVPRTEKLEGVDRPEPDQALAGTAARTRDHDPADQDDRELLLDDPALPEVALDEDDGTAVRPDEPSYE